VSSKAKHLIYSISIQNVATVPSVVPEMFAGVEIEKLCHMT